MIITDDLARRLEIAEALDAAGCAEAACGTDPECGAAVGAAGGGVLIFCGAVSPLTRALGVALHGPVTEHDIDEVEQFFDSRGAPVIIDVCPHADSTLLEILTAREYRVSEMSNVLVRSVGTVESFPQYPGVVVVPAEDADTYARIMMSGFFGREHITAEEFRLGTVLYHMPCASPLLALIDGEPAGGCGMSVRNGVASFFGDATLPGLRQRSVQSALIAERLRRAAAAGCELATAGTVPGSISQRNYGRFGFEVAYTKITMVRG